MSRIFNNCCKKFTGKCFSTVTIKRRGSVDEKVVVHINVDYRDSLFGTIDLFCRRGFFRRE
jgi:hypothetical protein